MGKLSDLEGASCSVSSTLHLPVVWMGPGGGGGGVLRMEEVQLGRLTGSGIQHGTRGSAVPSCQVNPQQRLQMLTLPLAG